MILKNIDIQNFRNIKNIKIDFSSNSAGSDKDLSRGYFREVGKGKILPQVSALIGPNSVGKTNIFSALAFLDYMTADNVNIEAARKVAIFLTNHKENMDRNNLEIKTDSFLKRLKNNNISDKELEVFLTKKNETIEKYYLKNANSYNKEIKICAIFWDPNSNREFSVEMSLSKTGLEFSIPAKDFFKRKWTFNFDRTSFNITNAFSNTANFYDPMVLELYNQIGSDKLKKVIKLADPTILDVYKKENKILFIKEGSDIDIDFHSFSSGTKRILYIYSFLLSTLSKKGSGVYLIDEIELFLHRELAIAVIDTMNMLSKKNKNVSFIFTTHNPLILGENIKFKQVHEIRIDSLSGNHSAAKLSTLFKGHENIEAKYKKGIISRYPSSSIIFDTIYDLINE